MGWKDWSYTKRGAVIGIILGIILLLIGLWFFLKCPIGFADSVSSEGICKSYITLLAVPFAAVTIGILLIQANVFNVEGLNLAMSISPFVFILISLFIGALIGYIVGKIKSRKIDATQFPFLERNKNLLKKGFIIGASIGFIIYLFLILFSIFSGDAVDSVPFIILIIVTVITGCVGILIGFIIGKIKSKKPTPTQKL